MLIDLSKPLTEKHGDFNGTVMTDNVYINSSAPEFDCGSLCDANKKNGVIYATIKCQGKEYFVGAAVSLSMSMPMMFVGTILAVAFTIFL